MVARGAERNIKGRLSGYVVSAGFVNIDGSAYGESESLGVPSRKEDTEILRKYYNFKGN